MDTQQPQMINKKRGGGEEENSKPEPKPKEGQSNTITCSSPPSPSHEFSFTISLQPSSTSPSDKTNKSPPSFAIDLSPADEIFFHGHLLPLHLLSHLPISPSSSTNSFECSTPPIKDVLQEDQKPKNDNNNNNISKGNGQIHGNNGGTKKRIKVKSFSIFRPAKWRKQCEIGDREEEKHDETTTTTKKKEKFDASHIWKRYLRMVRPLMFFRGRSKNCQLQMKPHSFSSNNLKGKQEQRKRTNSAPASMQTSATNSGSLTKVKLPSSMNDSSMDELQSAIEAAIAHCKSSSTTKEEKFKFQY